MPFSYGYAMTIRRSQGSTLEMVTLWFDHKYPADRGYGYVGAPRVERAADLFFMGKIRRTDWMPVAGNVFGDEQDCRGSESKSDIADSEDAHEDQGESSESDENQVRTEIENAGGEDVESEDQAGSDAAMGSDGYRAPSDDEGQSEAMAVSTKEKTAGDYPRDCK